MPIGSIPPITSTGPNRPNRGLNRRLRSVDPVRFRTRGVGTGMGGVQKSDTWKTPAPVRRAGRRTVRQSVGRFPRQPEQDIFHDSKSYQVIIYDIPFRDPKDVRCEIIDNTLVIESLLDGFEFHKEFSLPENILHSTLKIRLENAILDIHLNKKKKEKRSLKT